MTRLMTLLSLTSACVFASTASGQAALVWHSALDGNATAIVGLDGVATGTPIAATDKNGNVGGAVDFGSGNNYFEIDASPEITSLTAGSISAWVLWRSQNGDRGIVSVGDSGGADYFTLMRNKNSALRADADDGSTRRPAAEGDLSTNTWYHVVTTFEDGDILRLYVDGTEVDTKSLAGDETYTGLDTWLIGTARTNSRFLNGIIDDVRIYDNAISATEVGTLFDNGPLFVEQVPEPGSLALLAAGLLALVGIGLKRRRG